MKMKLSHVGNGYEFYECFEKIKKSSTQISTGEKNLWSTFGVLLEYFWGTFGVLLGHF